MLYLRGLGLSALHDQAKRRRRNHARPAPTVEPDEIPQGRLTLESGSTGEDGKPSNHRTIYDSEMEEIPFSSWTYFATSGVSGSKFPRSAGGELGMRSISAEVVGLDKLLPMVKGTIRFEYGVAEYSRLAGQAYFAVIPMQANSLDRAGLIEVGAGEQDDPANPTSLYRQRYSSHPSITGMATGTSTALSLTFGARRSLLFGLCASDQRGPLGQVRCDCLRSKRPRPGLR